MTCVTALDSIGKCAPISFFKSELAFFSRLSYECRSESYELIFSTERERERMRERERENERERERE